MTPKKTLLALLLILPISASAFSWYYPNATREVNFTLMNPYNTNIPNATIHVYFNATYLGTDCSAYNAAFAFTNDTGMYGLNQTRYNAGWLDFNAPTTAYYNATLRLVNFPKGQSRLSLFCGTGYPVNKSAAYSSFDWVFDGDNYPTSLIKDAGWKVDNADSNSTYTINLTNGFWNNSINMTTGTIGADIVNAVTMNTTGMIFVARMNPWKTITQVEGSYLFSGNNTNASIVTRWWAVNSTDWGFTLRNNNALNITTPFSNFKVGSWYSLGVYSARTAASTHNMSLWINGALNKTRINTTANAGCASASCPVSADVTALFVGRMNPLATKAYLDEVGIVKSPPLTMNESWLSAFENTTLMLTNYTLQTVLVPQWTSNTTTPSNWSTWSSGLYVSFNVSWNNNSQLTNLVYTLNSSNATFTTGLNQSNTTLPAGYYTWNATACSVMGCNTTNSWGFTLAKATPALTFQLNGTSANFSLYTTNETVNTSYVKSNAAYLLSATLYRNGTSNTTGNPQFQVSTITNAPTTYNWTLIFAGDANYTNTYQEFYSFHNTPAATPTPEPTPPPTIDDDEVDDFSFQYANLPTNSLPKQEDDSTLELLLVLLAFAGLFVVAAHE